jgi:DnaJ-class molecular chaperone
MRNTILVLLLSVIFTATNGQKKDEKILKQANAFVVKGDFERAGNVLEGLSPDGKTTLSAISLKALILDSLRIYSLAIPAYEQLLNQGSNNTTIANRITYLQIELAKNDSLEAVRLRAMKSCLKCSGTGYISHVENCPACNGFRFVQKDCMRCHGEGRISCSKCGGTGRVEIQLKDGRTISAGCGKCGSEGKLECNNNCQYGKVTDYCRKCAGEGLITVTLKCDLH